MFLKKLIRSFLSGVRRVNKRALHAGKGHAKAKPSAAAAKRVKKAALKRPGANPLSANDPAHSPGHRKMNWKKYQETSKMSRKAAARP